VTGASAGLRAGVAGGLLAAGVGLVLLTRWRRMRFTA
jgi:hypothetical protein